MYEPTLDIHSTNGRGFYFYHGTNGEVTIVQVRCNPYCCPTDPSERYLANFIGDDASYFAHDFPGDWAGPLTLPAVSPDAFLAENLRRSKPNDLHSS